MAICFDIFRFGGDLRAAQERDAELYSLFNGGNIYDPIIRVPIFGNLNGSNTELLKKTMDEVIEKKWRGFNAFRPFLHLYFRTDKALLKVKRMQEFVGRIIDVEIARPGTKIEGMVASVICEVPGCTIPVKVGSGFNDAERIEMTINSPIGKRN